VKAAALTLGGLPLLPVGGQRRDSSARRIDDERGAARLDDRAAISPDPELVGERRFEIGAEARIAPGFLAIRGFGRLRLSASRLAIAAASSSLRNAFPASSFGRSSGVIVE
jgi:hypothetical protein